MVSAASRQDASKEVRNELKKNTYIPKTKTNDKCSIRPRSIVAEAEYKNKTLWSNEVKQHHQLRMYKLYDTMPLKTRDDVADANVVAAVVGCCGEDAREKKSSIKREAEVTLCMLRPLFWPPSTHISIHSALWFSRFHPFLCCISFALKCGLCCDARR